MWDFILKVHRIDYCLNKFPLNDVIIHVLLQISFLFLLYCRYFIYCPALQGVSQCHDSLFWCILGLFSKYLPLYSTLHGRFFLPNLGVYLSQPFSRVYPFQNRVTLKPRLKGFHISPCMQLISNSNFFLFS